MNNICNPDCIYYPKYPNKIIKEYINKYGIKEREAEFLCDYDDHRILKFEKCDNYRRINE